MQQRSSVVASILSCGAIELTRRGFMWPSRCKTARGLVAGTLAVALAGCGGGGHPTPLTAKKQTVAEACRQHRTAVATIVGGLVEYKTYMTTEDPAFLLTFKRSGIAERIRPAIRTLERSSGAAPRTSGGQLFFHDLDELEGWLKSPAAVPSAVVGDRNASKLEAAAKAAGCTLASR
jgi:hypothetical protein